MSNAATENPGENPGESPGGNPGENPADKLARKLARMANQIAQELENQVGVAAPAAIADHIRQFWDPRMRHQLAEYIARDNNVVRPSCIAAFKILKAGQP
ncbi:MAG: formate dehydrogenase subunit delta [Sphingomonas sp.]|jgi:formate dehydrogenase subunit delta